MNGFHALENAAQYLETVIEEGCGVDYEKISGIVGYPAALFQRVFTFVAGKSISEYVRRRTAERCSGPVLHKSTFDWRKTDHGRNDQN